MNPAIESGSAGNGMGASAEDDGDTAMELGAGIDFTNPNSPLARFYCRRSALFTVFFLCAGFVLISHLTIWHTDVWGHMRFGEYIVEQRALPARESFSGDYADQDAPYVNYQWIAQAGAYLVFQLGRTLSAPDAIHRLGGGALCLAAAHAFVVTLRMSLLFWAFRRLSRSTPTALAGIVLVFVLGMFCHLFIQRPQVLGELAFAGLLLALSESVPSKRAVMGASLVMIFWANAHGSVAIGFILLGIAFVGAVTDAMVLAWPGRKTGRWSWLSWSNLRHLALSAWKDDRARRIGLMLFCGLAGAACLNPHGPMLFWHSLQLAKHPNIQFMEEWKALPLKSISGLMFLASALLLAVLIRLSPARFTATQTLLLVVFGWQSLAHARFMVWWIMVLPWVAAPHMKATWDYYLPNLAGERNVPSLRKTILAFLIAGVTLMWSAPCQWLLWRDAPVAQKKLNPATPLAASNYLKGQFRKDPSLVRRVFTSETMGDFLLWDLRLDPPVQVFCYTHVHLFTPEHWREAVQIKAADPGWREILDREGIEFIVVDTELHGRLVGQVRAMPDRWQIVADEPVFIAKKRPQATKQEERSSIQSGSTPRS